MSAAARAARSASSSCSTRDAEHRHDRVADELLDRPAVALDRRPHRVEVPRLHVPHGLGIELLAQRGGAGHVAEHDGDGLADLARGGGGGERGRARRTEREVVRALAPTVRAGQHRPSVRPRAARRYQRASTSSGCTSNARWPRSRPFARWGSRSVPAFTPVRSVDRCQGGRDRRDHRSQDRGIRPGPLRYWHRP